MIGSDLIRPTPKRIAFVGGIHGVGKTTLCREVAKRLGVPHISASSVIRSASGSRLAADKRVVGIERNQDALLEGLSQLPHDRLVLDGHYCLLTGDSRVARVPMTTFATMAPIALVIIVGNVDDICVELARRDRVNHDPSVLLALQDAERRHADEVSTSIGAPLLCATRMAEQDVEQFLRGQLNAV
jgi:adenylate kinase